MSSTTNEQALEAAAINNDLTPFDQLLDALRDPYIEREAACIYAKPASLEQTVGYRTFCGTCNRIATNADYPESIDVTAKLTKHGRTVIGVRVESTDNDSPLIAA